MHERALISGPSVNIKISPVRTTWKGGIVTHVFFSQPSSLGTPDRKTRVGFVQYQKHAGKLIEAKGNHMPIGGKVVFGKGTAVARPIALPDWIETWRSRPGPIF